MPRFLVSFMLSLVSMSACCATSRIIDVGKLGETPKAFLGVPVSFRACLIDATPHGEYIQPCGHHGSKGIIIVSDQDFKDPFSVVAGRQKPWQWVHCVQGTFKGVVVSKIDGWPKHEVMEIHLTSVSDLSLCKA